MSESEPVPGTSGSSLPAIDDVDLYRFDDEEDDEEEEEETDDEQYIHDWKELLKKKSPIKSSYVDSGNAMDPFSKSFDPVEALYEPGVEEFMPDMDKAKVYDNVDKFISVMEGKAHDPNNPNKQSKEAKAREQATLKRQFLPHQMPVEKVRKAKPNVLKWMNEFKTKDVVQSPLKALASAREERAKVTVHIRGRNRMRGHCTGFLLVFDKHWNLVLKDVEETWRRCRRPTLVAGVDEISEDLRLTQLDGKKWSNREHRVGHSVIRVVKTMRNVEICQRYVPQLLIRGEHVCTVVINR